jgi:hypothetical protein
MNRGIPMDKEEALRFVRAVTGGRQYVHVDGDTFHRVMGMLHALTPVEETSSLHWWEDIYDIDGELYAVGGPHGDSVHTIQHIVFI